MSKRMLEPGILISRKFYREIFIEKVFSIPRYNNGGLDIKSFRSFFHFMYCFSRTRLRGKSLLSMEPRAIPSDGTLDWGYFRGLPHFWWWVMVSARVEL
jgi:hypothetical protein